MAAAQVKQKPATKMTTWIKGERMTHHLSRGLRPSPDSVQEIKGAGCLNQLFNLGERCGAGKQNEWQSIMLGDNSPLPTFSPTKQYHVFSECQMNCPDCPISRASSLLLSTPWPLDPLAPSPPP